MFEEPPLKRDGVIEEELRCPFENLWDCIPGEVPIKWARYVGEHKGNVVGQGFGEDGGQSGQRVIGSGSHVRDSAIDEEENGSDGVDMLLDLSCNTLLVELILILLKTASVGQARCVEDANLGRRLAYSPHSDTLARTTRPFLLVNS